MRSARVLQAVIGASRVPFLPNVFGCLSRNVLCHHQSAGGGEERTTSVPFQIQTQQNKMRFPKCKADVPITLVYHSKVKVEEFVTDMRVTASSVCLPKDPMKSLATLQNALYPYFSLHNINCCLIINDQEFEHCEAFVASMDFVLAALQYNIRRVWDDENSSHYIFAASVMYPMVRVCSDILGRKSSCTSPAACCILNCGIGYFPNKLRAGEECSVWFWAWSRRKEGDSSIWSGIGSNLLHKCCCYFQWFLCSRTPQHVNVAEEPIYFWCRVLLVRRFRPDHAIRATSSTHYVSTVDERYETKQAGSCRG